MLAHMVAAAHCTGRILLAALVPQADLSKTGHDLSKSLRKKPTAGGGAAQFAVLMT